MCAANAIGKGKASSSPRAPASLKGFSFSGAMTLAYWLLNQLLD